MRTVDVPQVARIKQFNQTNTDVWFDMPMTPVLDPAVVGPGFRIWKGFANAPAITAAFRTQTAIRIVHAGPGDVSEVQWEGSAEDITSRLSGVLGLFRLPDPFPP